MTEQKKTTNKIIRKKIKFNDRELSLSTGELAQQTSASVVAQVGETIVLATVVSSAPRRDLNYFPLTVEYREKLYAGGKIKGSRWVKREGSPTEDATLAARLIDRSIRPLFPKDFKNEVQIVITVLSVDAENDPVILAVTATSAALAISEIPWDGPIGGTRVALVVSDKQSNLLANPLISEMAYSNLDLVVSSTEGAVLMVEAGSKEVEEKTMLSAMELAVEENKKIINLIKEFQKEAGKTKLPVVHQEKDLELYEEVKKETKPYLTELMTEGSNLQQVGERISQKFGEEDREAVAMILEEIIKKEVRRKILEESVRPDGRKLDEIRPLTIKVGVLPRTHGSAIFQRGKTQALTISTLGSPEMEQLVEGMTGEETKRYIHHYNMPPFSTGECGRFGWPSRREVGHGALAEKALEPVIPADEEFPYTIRVVSEIMSSNGSTSMASVCGSTLSLMDAGVPIKAPVAGISIGLVTDDKTKKGVTLVDIMGLEDGCGDMDFKVAGTEKGITAIQLDVKVNTLTLAILEKAMDQARKVRLYILEKIKDVIPKPREQISKYAPKVMVVHIPPEKIGEVIGPGGRMIKKIMAESGASIDIEDSGEVAITGTTLESVNKAAEVIKSLTKELEAGQIFEGEVKRIQPFGAFVEILPGKDGLVHVSRMGQGFVKDPGDVVKIGQKVRVKLLRIDDMGRLDLTMNLDEQPGEATNRPRPPRRFGPPNRFGPPRPYRR